MVEENYHMMKKKSKNQKYRFELKMIVLSLLVIIRN